MAKPRKTNIKAKASEYKVKAFKLLLYKGFEEEDAASLEAIINLAESVEEEEDI